MTALPGKPAANSKPDNGMSELLSASPGARLQRARESKNMEVSQAAESLNLSPGVVKSLEADDYRALPNATFVKGYLRSYARLLEIPGEELVRSYESICAADKPKQQAPLEPPKGGTKPFTFLVGGVALVVVVLAWLFWPTSSAEPEPEVATGIVQQPGEIELPATQQSEPVSVELAPVSQPEPEPTPLESAVVSAEEALLEESVVEEPLVDEAVVEEGVAEETVAQVSSGELPSDQTPAEIALAEAESEFKPSNPVSDPVSVAPPIDPSVGKIEMAFTGDCWVEIRDANDKLIFSNLKRHGDTLSIQGAPPLEAKLGNGNVVSLSYNGQPVTFRVPSHNVVRVRLGE